MKKKQTKTKGFTWRSFVTPANIANSDSKDWVIYGGNFVLWLELPNALKIKGFKTLKDRLEKYVNSHSGKFPTEIKCTRRQYSQYENLFLRQIKRTDENVSLMFQGIPMIRYGTKITR